MEEFSYFAFISYKREDEKWAKWLQHKLEHYKLPSSVRKTNSNLPREVRPIFRDTTELASGILPNQIHKAITSSKYLIVICSPRSAKSEWVNKEVQSFIDSGRVEQVIPFIVDGTPNAHVIEEECYPLALRNLPKEEEILGISISEAGEEPAAIKVIAQMLGLRFDILWQRYEREQRRKRRIIILSSTIIGLLGLVIAITIGKLYWGLLANQSRYVAERARTLLEQGDSYEAMKLAVEVLPRHISRPNRPYVPDAEAVLRDAYASSTATFSPESNSFIHSAILNHDGTKVIVGYNNGDILIVDVESGNTLKSIEPCGEFVSVIPDRDMSRFYAVSWDSSVQIRNVEDASIIKSFEVVPSIFSWFKNAALSSDGKRIYIGTTDNPIRVLDTESGSLKYEFGRDSLWTDNIAISPDDKTFALVSKDGSLEVWDVSTQKTIKRIGSEHKRFSAIVFSPDGSVLATGALDHSIYLWNTKDWKLLNRLEGHESSISSLLYVKSGRRLISGSSDGSIIIWDSETNKRIKSLISSSSSIVSVASSEDGNVIMSASSDGTIQIWHKSSKILKADYSPHSHWVTSLSFSPDGKRIASGSLWDNSIAVQNLYSLEDSVHFYDFFSFINSVSFSKTGDKIFATTWTPGDKAYSFQPNGRISYYEDESSSSEDIFTTDDSGDMTFNITEFDNALELGPLSPDGAKVFSRSGFTIKEYDAKSGSIIDTRDITSSNASALGISPNGKMLIELDGDNTILIRNIRDGRIIRTILAPMEHLGCVAMSPDNRLLACADFDTIHLWDLSSVKVVKSWKAHNEKWIHSLSFSPDSKQIVSASDDHTVKVWDLDSGIALYTFLHPEAVISTAISPDGRAIATGAYDHKVRVWEYLSLQELIDNTKERFKENWLSEEDLKNYHIK